MPFGAQSALSRTTLKDGAAPFAPARSTTRLRRRNMLNPQSSERSGGTSAVPRHIARYEIRRELGRGGMAVVYLAHDPAVKRQVAVKVLPRQFTFDPQFRDRFHREAEAIAGLEHPAITPIYDYGEEDDQPYIV